MRAMFGLAGMLVVLAVIVWFMSKGGLANTAQTIKTGNAARDQVNRIAGNDPETGERASHSAKFEGMMLANSNKLTGLLVVSVTADGAYSKYFGLKRSDTIVAAEYQGARMDMKSSSDEEMAKAWVEEAYRRQGAVFVVRDGKELKLPAAAPGTPAGVGQPPKRDELQQQLDAIQGVPR